MTKLVGVPRHYPGSRRRISNIYGEDWDRFPQIAQKAVFPAFLCHLSRFFPLSQHFPQGPQWGHLLSLGGCVKRLQFGFLLGSLMTCLFGTKEVHGLRACCGGSGGIGPGARRYQSLKGKGIE